MKPTVFAEQDWGSGLVHVALRAGGWSPAGGDPLERVPDSREVWAVFAQADALAAPGFERLVLLAAVERPDAAIFYAADAALGEPGPDRVRLKPAFDRTLLAADDCIGAPLIVRGSALHVLGGLRPEMGEAALYDLVLRAAEAGMGVVGLPQTLLAYPDRRPRVPAADRRRALTAALATAPLEVGPGLTPQTLRLSRRFESWPEVTLVVPTRQAGPPDESGPPFIIELLDSLAALDWPMDRLHVLVGDDTDRPETLPEGRWPFRVRRIATPRAPGEPFSYAAKMNRLWRAVETEQMVLLNDDVSVRSKDWLQSLLTFSMEPDVGGVGGRLLFPDGRVQHAGMAGGLFGGVTHLWVGQRGDAATYQDWAVSHREWSMVTGAVFATRRSVMEAANGFDERFSVEFNDVDLCLRLRMMGYRIVYTPFAEAIHREMASRGAAPPAAGQSALFLSRWRQFLADDPAFHPRLTRTLSAPVPMDEPDWFDR